MDKVFTVETKGKRDVWPEAHLPMTPFEMLDLLDKEGLTPEETPTGEIRSCHISIDANALLEGKQHNLYELNALAWKLVSMDDIQRIAFNGLVKMETDKMEGPVPLGRLIDLAYGVDCCHVAPEISSDTQLGRFYAENGFLPEVEGLPEALYEILDYASLGRRARVDEGGVFTAGGYVVKDSEPKEVFASLDLKPHKPEYAILLEMAQGDRTTQLHLPTSLQAMNTALNTIGARDWGSVFLRCLDCRAPALIPAIGEGNNIAHINQLAEILEQMDDRQLTRFKAVLDATEDYSVPGAIHIAATLDDYLFSPQYVSAEDMAKDFIRASMGEPAASELYPFVQLERYGAVVFLPGGRWRTRPPMPRRAGGCKNRP